MATQVQIALGADTVSGTAIFAAGPWGCAERNVVTAQTVCETGPVPNLYINALVLWYQKLSVMGAVAKPADLAQV